jgi:hypothetical protein
MLEFGLLALLIAFVTLTRWLGICLLGRKLPNQVRMLADWSSLLRENVRDIWYGTAGSVQRAGSKGRRSI